MCGWLSMDVQRSPYRKKKLSAPKKGKTQLSVIPEEHHEFYSSAILVAVLALMFFLLLFSYQERITLFGNAIQSDIGEDLFNERASSDDAASSSAPSLLTEYVWQKDYWTCQLYSKEYCSIYPHIKTAGLLYGSQFVDSPSGESQRQIIEAELGIDDLHEWAAQHYDFVSPWGGGDREDFLIHNPHMRSLMYNILGGGGYVIGSADNLVNRRLFSWFDYAQLHNIEDLEQFYVHVAEDIDFPCSFISGCGPSFEAVFENVYYEKEGVPTDYTYQAFGYYHWAQGYSGRVYYEIPFGEEHSALYLGDMTKFAELHVNLVQVASNDFAPIFEYWNGGEWSSLTLIDDATNNFQRSGVIRFMPPADWKARTPSFNPRGTRLIYEIRIRSESAPTQNPIAQTYQLASGGALQNVPAEAGSEAPGVSAFHSEIFIPREYAYWEFDPNNEDAPKGTIIELNVTFLGWNDANDQNGDGYVDDDEFASLVDEKATARFQHQARSAGYLYQYMSYATNFKSEAVADWIIQALIDDYDASAYDGIMIDSLGRAVRSRCWNNSIKFIEYPGGLYDSQYEEAIRRIMIALQDSLPGEIVLGNNNLRLYYNNITDGGEGELFFDIKAMTRSRFTQRAPIVVQEAKNEKILLVHNQAYTSDGLIDIERNNMFALASYYLIDYNTTYFWYQSSLHYGTPWDYWFDAITYDAGAPLGDYYEFASGDDPSYAGHDYTIFARDRQKGLVLVKLMPSTTESSLDDDSQTSHSLPGTYRRLTSDGSLAPGILSTVSLRNNEGVVLINTCFDREQNGDEEGIDCGGSCDQLCPVDVGIIPKPKQVSKLAEGNISLDNMWTIVAEPAGSQNFSAHYFADWLTSESEGDIELSITDFDVLPFQNRIVFGNPEENTYLAQQAELYDLDVASLLSEDEHGQGYVIYVAPDEILVLGLTDAGIFYGAVTLTWLMNWNWANFQTPQVLIVDWPDLEIRGFYGGSSPNLPNPFYTDKYDWFDELAKYKYNLWIGGVDTISNGSSSTSIARSRAQVNYLRDRQFFISMSAYPISTRNYDPNVQEGVWVQDYSFTFDEHDVAVATSPENISLLNEGFEGSINEAGEPEGWYFKYQNVSGGDFWSVDCDTGNAHTGSCAAKLTQTFDRTHKGSGAHILTINYSDGSYPISEGKLYYLNVWLKKDAMEEHTVNPQITVVLQDEFGESSGPSRSTIMRNWTNDWVEQQIAFVTYPGTTTVSVYSKDQGSPPVSFWMDDFEIIDGASLLSNIVSTPASEIEVWNVPKTIKYVAGEDYSLTSVGEFDEHNPLNGKQTTIHRIPSGRIAPNQEVLVSFDFIISFQDTREPYHSLADPLALEIYENVFVEPTLSNFDPDFLFIGMDEIRGYNRDSRSRKLDLENYQLLAQHINSVVDIIESHDSEVKILFWDDMTSPFHNGRSEDAQLSFGGQLGKGWYALDLLDRDLIPIIWWYGDYDYWHKLSDSMNYYDLLGYDSFSGPSVYGSLNNKRWSSQIANEHDAFGMIGHEFYNRVDHIDLVANYSWNLQTFPGDVNPSNFEVCDGRDNDGDALHQLSSSRNVTWPSAIDEGFNLTSDIFNCGSCGTICYYPKSFTSCSQGTCQFDGCYDDYYNRDGSLANGCEVYCKKTNNGVERRDGVDNDCDGSIDEGLGGGNEGGSSGSSSGGVPGGSSQTLQRIQEEQEAIPEPVEHTSTDNGSSLLFVNDSDNMSVGLGDPADVDSLQTPSFVSSLFSFIRDLPSTYTFGAGGVLFLLILLGSGIVVRQHEHASKPMYTPVFRQETSEQTRGQAIPSILSFETFVHAAKDISEEQKEQVLFFAAEKSKSHARVSLVDKGLSFQQVEQLEQLHDQLKHDHHTYLFIKQSQRQGKTKKEVIALLETAGWQAKDILQTLSNYWDTP
ncbi:MAG: hypothetical protein H6502_01295 [Candidatus Woesearchaeota archaeon]|nr:MAG: hypothetical protein H6502_01295 [Candidatus Woesearchaeota archaeon]